MPFTARIFRLLESELNKHLAFSFTIARRIGDKGRPISVLKVWLRNDSGLALRDVRGAINPAPAASFAMTPFHLASLAPGEEREIAQIEARILEPTSNRFAFERMATVDVSSSADLSRFRFSDRSRALAHVQAPLSEMPAEPARLRRTHRPALVTTGIALGRKPA